MAQPDSATDQVLMVKISKTADPKPNVHPSLFSCPGLAQTWRKFGTEAKKSAAMLIDNAIIGSPVRSHKPMPTKALTTQNLFKKSQLLSPFLTDKIATPSWERQSQRGNIKTYQGAPAAFELTTVIIAKIDQVHHDAPEGLV